MYAFQNCTTLGSVRLGLQKSNPNRLNILNRSSTFPYSATVHLGCRQLSVDVNFYKQKNAEVEYLLQRCFVTKPSSAVQYQKWQLTDTT